METTMADRETKNRELVEKLTKTPVSDERAEQIEAALKRALECDEEARWRILFEEFPQLIYRF